MVVGRFQVMAMLQSARAYLLGLPLESALSWAHHLPHEVQRGKMWFKSEMAAAGGVYHLGDEMAFKVERDGNLFFTVGGEVKTDKDLVR